MPQAWPPTLRFFIAHDGLSRSGPLGGTIRTQMDTGPAKVRRRFTAAPRRFTGVTPKMTKAELATFESFYETTLAMGALSFTAEDPLDCTSKTFRFVSGYEVVPTGRSFRVSAELEILP